MRTNINSASNENKTFTVLDCTANKIDHDISRRVFFPVWSDKRRRQLTELNVNTKMALSYPLHF